MESYDYETDLDLNECDILHQELKTTVSKVSKRAQEEIKGAIQHINKQMWSVIGSIPKTKPQIQKTLKDVYDPLQKYGYDSLVLFPKVSRCLVLSVIQQKKFNEHHISQFLRDNKYLCSSFGASLTALYSYRIMTQINKRNYIQRD